MMKYRMLLSDIDGTLRPFSSAVIPPENVEAISAVQALGVKFVISTGRSRFGLPDELLNGIRPDYWICAAGAQVLMADGTEIMTNRIPAGYLEALTEFCSERDIPLRFVFSDGVYVYSGLEEYQQWAMTLGARIRMTDGRDHRRHFTELPFAANAILTDEEISEFASEYPGADLRFPVIQRDHRDILWQGQSKAAGLEKLLEISGLTMEECVSVGDGANDVELLSATGMSYCMADGAPRAKAAAKRICPPAEEFGVAAVCRELWKI